MEPAVTPSRRKRLRHGMRGSCWGSSLGPAPPLPRSSCCYFWQRQAPCWRKRCLWGHTQCALTHTAAAPAWLLATKAASCHRPTFPCTRGPTPLTAPPPTFTTVLGDWEWLQRLTPSAGACAEASLVRHVHPSVLIPPLCPLPLAHPAAWLSHVLVVTALLSPARHQPLMEHRQGWLLVQTGLLGVPDTRGPPLRRA